MTTEMQTTQESNSTTQEFVNKNTPVSTPNSSVSRPKRTFSSRRLGERLFLVGISAALLGLGYYYVTITDLAFNYESKLQNQKPSKDELLPDEGLETEIPVSQDLIEPVTPTATVTYESLNVRKEGDSTAEKIGILYLNQEVTILENDESSDYVKIDFNGAEGYVHRDYLEFQ